MLIESNANATLLGRLVPQTKRLHLKTSSAIRNTLNFVQNYPVVILCIIGLIGWRYRSKLYFEKIWTWILSGLSTPQKNELCIFALNSKTLRKVEQLMRNLLSEIELDVNEIVITTHHVTTRKIEKRRTVKLAICCGNRSERLILCSEDEPDEMSAMLDWTERNKVSTVIIIDGMDCEEDSLYDHSSISDMFLRGQPKLKSYIETDRFFTIRTDLNHRQKQATLRWLRNSLKKSC